MKLQDVILKAIAKRITWVAAAEIAGMSALTMDRMRQKYEEFGYDGLYDQLHRKRFVHRIPLATAEQVLTLYQETYAGQNVWRFYQKLRTKHKIDVSYSWVKQALRGAGLVEEPKKTEALQALPPVPKAAPPRTRPRRHIVRSASFR
jgi:hypothetical protein